MKAFLAAFAVSAVLLSCEKNKDVPLKGKDLMLTAAEKRQAGHNNAFTFKLFKAVSENEPSDKNLFISPLSAAIALGMTSNGSSDETLEAMRSTLGFSDMTEDEMNSYFKKLSSDLPLLDPKTTFNTANSIWYRKGFEVLPEFKKTNSEYYEAVMEELNFSGPSAKETINLWVKDKTKDKITTIIDDPIPDNTVMYLINAIYFKGQWKYQFDKSQTKKLPFHTDKNNSIRADFMIANADVRSFYSGGNQILELPYGNEKFSMVILMPAEGEPLEAFANALTPDTWDQSMAEMKPLNANVILPKFKFDYENELNNELSKIGMGIAFTDQADFTRINPGGNLKISKVKQKAFVEVNEEGTEAAAVTSVGLELTSLPSPKVPPTIIINRPFLFAIKENNTGLILFIGKMNNPV